MSLARLPPPNRYEGPRGPSPLELFERFIDFMGRLIAQLLAAASTFPTRAARFLRAPTPVSVVAVCLWAAALLAPGSAHALSLGEMIPKSASEVFTLIGVGVSGGASLAVGVLALRWIGPWAMEKLGLEFKLELKKVEAAEAETPEAMEHPEALAIVTHQEDCLGDAVVSALDAAGHDFSTIKSIDKDTLLGVATDAEAAFMKGVDKEQLLQALETLGQQTGGDVLTWVKGRIMSLLFHAKANNSPAPAPVPAQPAAPAPRVKIPLADADDSGPHSVVAPIPA